ncbi:unnamed protein product [Ilex paraguariensis]|uniref:Uncharacterized protein n=1 Tax=Ilex paraguariensis TaxID=185542 RepID=A0ABC8SKC9_9AQUA
MAPKGKEKSKPSVSQPAIAIEDLLTTLNCHIDRSEFDQAILVIDQVLAIVHGDEDAIRCKIVALVKDDKIDEALLAIVEYSRKCNGLSV